MDELLNSQIMNTRLFNNKITGLASKCDIVILKENSIFDLNKSEIFINSKFLYGANDETTIYEKIDIFSDVLDKINKLILK